MPKALPGVRSTIMEASRKQLFEGGYGAMTLRSVAAECGISIGTIYHYFSSKDELILTLVNEKWLNALSALSEKCITAASARDAIQWVYDELSAFFVFLSRILNDLPAGSYELFSPNNHRAKKQEQLTRLLQPVTDRFARVKNPFLCGFVCDAIIFEVENRRPFMDFYSVISVFFIDAA